MELISIQLRAAVSALIILAVLLTQSGCGDEVTLYDFWGECAAELPFEYSDSSYAGSQLYFSSELTLDEMVSAYSAAGHIAEIIDCGGERRAYIVISGDNANGQFMLTSGDGRYVLSQCDYLTSAPDGYMKYHLPAPVYLLGDEVGENKYIFYGDYDDLSFFYGTSGREDYELGEESVRVECKTSPTSPSHGEGWVELRLTNDGENNYIEFVKAE